MSTCNCATTGGRCDVCSPLCRAGHRDCVEKHGDPCTMRYLATVFPELHNKRMNELTLSQRWDACEDWIRANAGFVVRDYDQHIPFLLARIDKLRDAIADYQLASACNKWLGVPSHVYGLELDAIRNARRALLGKGILPHEVAAALVAACEAYKRPPPTNALPCGCITGRTPDWVRRRCGCLTSAGVQR